MSVTAGAFCVQINAAIQSVRAAGQVSYRASRLLQLKVHTTEV
jgi:hypothetical protein